LMPETAAITAGDNSLRRNSKALRDPSLNLRLGQDYFAWLLQHGVGDDILSAVAAYNSGPGTILKTQAQLGGSGDPLMTMECLPAQETRAYVEKVMAGYWLYRRQLGAQTASLDALASGAIRIPMNLEQAAKLPNPPTPPDVTLAATAPIDGHQD
jgi:soluble lytic murein transglycosylase